MLSLFCAVAFFGWVIWASIRRPTFLFATLFIIWQFALKILSTVYLDLFGPVYANEVATTIGGKGSSTFLLTIFLWIPLAIFYAFLGPRKESRLPIPEPRLHSPGTTFADFAVWGFAIFIVCLYFDMVRIGTIPFFSGLDRFEYKGGIFHNLLWDFVWLIAFILGYVLARSRIVTGAWDYRCIAIALALFAYLFLTGHRFGAFYVTTTFSCLGLAGLFYSRQQQWPVAPPPRTRSALQRLLQSPAMFAACAIGAAALVALALVNSLFVVRDYGSEAGDQVIQRLLVQPVELYWLTWERWIEGEVINGADALYFMFNDPFDPTRNSGQQYLMMLYLGEAQAFQQFVEQGQDYAGGYPEILIELGGVGIALIATAMISAIAGFLYRLCVVSVSRGHFMTAVMSIYFCYGVLGVFLGGMLNFVLAWTYWIKLVLLVSAVIVDWTLDRFGYRAFPWIIIPKLSRRSPPKHQEIRA